jgi:hypothetical protein
MGWACRRSFTKNRRKIEANFERKEQIKIINDEKRMIFFEAVFGID